MKKLILLIYHYVVSLFKKATTEIMIEQITEVFKKYKYANPKGGRNQNRCYASTKSFNGKQIPVVFGDDNNPEAKLYLQLKNRKRLLDIKQFNNGEPIKIKKFMSYKEWQKNRERLLEKEFMNYKKRQDSRFRKLRAAI